MCSTKFLGWTVTRQGILTATNKFDAQYPRPNCYDSWLDKWNYKYAVWHNGRPYPPKHVLTRAAGICKSRFGGGEQTNGVFRKLGF